jgi:ubiquinone/menaquinone biosynthesis C-methylase UbiE
MKINHSNKYLITQLLLAIMAIYSVSCSNLYTYKGNKVTYKKWFESTHKDYLVSDSFFKIVASKIKVNENDTITDIGGGFGYHSSMLAKYLPKSIVYFEEDISSKICSKKSFKRTFKFYNSTAPLDNFYFFVGTPTKTPFANKSSKIITVFISIHEFAYKDLMMTELKRILQDDGKLYIVESVYKNTPHIDPTCKIPYLSEMQLDDLLIKNGFRINHHNDVNKIDSSGNLISKFLECYKAN